MHIKHNMHPHTMRREVWHIIQTIHIASKALAMMAWHVWTLLNLIMCYLKSCDVVYICCVTYCTTITRCTLLSYSTILTPLEQILRGCELRNQNSLFWHVRGHCTIKTYCKFQNSKHSLKLLILKPMSQNDRLWNVPLHDVIVWLNYCLCRRRSTPANTSLFV